MVPAGQMQVLLQWNTEDRLNIEGAVFTLTGTNGTYTANGDASGRAEIIVPAGEYTIEVSHSGSYENDGPQKVIGESTQSYYVLFDAYFNRGASLFFKYTVTGATYALTKDEGGTTYEGQVVAGVERTVAPGSYHIVITCETHTWEGDVLITGDTVLSDYAIPIWSGSYPLRSISRDGVSVPITDGILISDEEYEMIATLDGDWKGGVPVTCHYDLLVDSAEAVTEPEYSDVLYITQSGDFTIPLTGLYDYMVVGGGGGASGGYASGTYKSSGAGGGSGYRSVQNNYSFSEGQILNVSLGAGGSGGGVGGAGGAGGNTVLRLGSSTGSVLRTGNGGGGATASSTYTGGNGGAGGAGGGGGYGTNRGGAGGDGQNSIGAASVSTDKRYGAGGGGANGFTFAGVTYGDTADPTDRTGGDYGGGTGSNSYSSPGNAGNFLYATVYTHSYCISDDPSADLYNITRGGGGGAYNASGGIGRNGAMCIALKVRA